MQSAPDDRVFRFQKELNESKFDINLIWYDNVTTNHVLHLYFYMLPVDHCLLQKVSGFAAHLGKDSAKVEK